MNEEQSSPRDVERLLAESDWLKRLASGLVRDPHAADDLVQDTFVAALRRAPQSSAGELRAWLTVVLRNFSRRRRRDADLRAQHERSSARDGDSAPSAAAIAARVELQRELAEALLALEEPYRSAIVLRYFDGLSAVQIAERLGISHENARQRIARGLAKLRTRLDREHESRGAWLALVQPLVDTSAPTPLLLPISLGGLAMGTFLKLAALAICVVLALTLWNWRSEDGPALAVHRGASEDSMLQAAPGPNAAEAPAERAPDSRMPVAADKAGAATALAVAGGDLTISGEVRDAHGVSVAGASIVALVFGDQGFSLLDSVHSSERRELDRAQSDEAGKFRLAVGRSGNVQLEVDAGLRGACLIGERQAGEHVIAIVLPQATIRGRVTRGKNGEPAVGARVRAVLALPDRGEEDRPDIRWGRDTQSDANGEYSLPGLPAGKYHVNAFIGGVGTGQALELGAGAIAECALDLGETVRVHGTVRDALTSSPIEAAEISTSWTFADPVRTNSRGEYELQVSNAFAHVLHARAPGYGVLEQKQPSSSSSDPFDFELLRSRSCRGVVLNQDGAPIAGAYVAAAAADFDKRGELQRIDWPAALTDATGGFEIVGLRADVAHSLLVRKPGFGARVFEFPAAESDSLRLDLGEIRLAAELEIGGTVRLESGAPLPGLKLALRGANKDRGRWSLAERPMLDTYVAERAGRSDALGRFSFHELSAGAYQVEAWLAGHNEPVSLNVTLEDGRSELEIALVIPAGSRLAGSIKDAQGQGVPDTYVSIEPELSDGRGLDVPTDEQGHFEARDVPAGQYTLRIWPGAAARTATLDRYLVPRTVEHVAAGRQDLEITLEEGVWLRGRVVESDGSEATDVFIEALGSDGKTVARTFHVGGAPFRLGVRRAELLTIVARPNGPPSRSPTDRLADPDPAHAARMSGVVGGGAEITLRLPPR